MIEKKKIGRPKKPRTKLDKVEYALERMDMKMLGEALTYRQRRFAEEYSIDFVGSAAAIRAGYSPKYADRQAHSLMKNKAIMAYVDHLVLQRSDQITAVDADYIVQGILKIIDEDKSRAGDKLRGYELLARLKGLFIDKQEISGKDGGAIEVEQRRVSEEAHELTTMLKAMNKRKDNGTSR